MRGAKNYQIIVLTFFLGYVFRQLGGTNNLTSLMGVVLFIVAAGFSVKYIISQRKNLIIQLIYAIILLLSIYNIFLFLAHGV